MGAGGAVTIAGRTFTLGAVYAPRAGRAGRRPRRLLRYEPDSPLPGGWVTLALVPSGRRRVVAGGGGGALAGRDPGRGPPVAVAHVRQVVGGGTGVGGAATIAGRAFALGAVHAARPLSP